MNKEEILHRLQKLGDKEHKAGMSRFGINTDAVLGITIPVLRQEAKTIGKNHQLALELWETKVHEARLLATFIADYKQITEELMEQWVLDFNSWDICDQCCGNLFDKTPWAFDKAVEWALRSEEFVKRAGFVMMAYLAVHNKKANNKEFALFFPLLEKEANDERNFVKKAVNWALRQLGKRNKALHKKAIAVAEKILRQESKAAKWIATDALRELRNEKIIVRIKD